eukprot:TRINITY_DN9967_c1_g4_i1.p1 TRINITY_DN9967_c1_g4~~TRINITY_DN9967_c1_g4_i1.p1  ORF type:complete len:1068 (-),score=182.95 TRINITY_DN9967_c1_g4_i1:49-2856(-)
MDAAAMKEKVRLALVKHKYDVCDFYKTQGVWQAVARHAFFERLTLAVIMANALWIAVDTDCNTAEILVHAHPIFQIAENLFCAFFSAEWLIRFTSFRRKLDSLRDGWFVFDMMMCVLMVVETWLFTIFVLVSGGGAPKVAGGAIARIARLMRLSRMCRMAKILRAMPELFVMLKGLRAAGRSVFFTLLLLTVIIFIFGIAFTQLAKETVLADAEFATVLDTSHFLLVHGTLLLSTDARALRIGEYGGWELETLFFVFILVAAVLLMNMLIGVLCEVVSAVACIEKEEMLVSYVHEKMTEVMALIDEDGGGTISRDEFIQILDNADAMFALTDVGVDVIGLVDFADFIFGDGDGKDDAPEIELTLPEFMGVVLQLRGSNSATVKDIVDLRKFVSTSLDQSCNLVSQMSGRHDEMEAVMKENLQLLDHIKELQHTPASPSKRCDYQELAVLTQSGSHEAEFEAQVLKKVSNLERPMVARNLDDPHVASLLLAFPETDIAASPASVPRTGASASGPSFLRTTSSRAVPSGQPRFSDVDIEFPDPLSEAVPTAVPRTGTGFSVRATGLGHRVRERNFLVDFPESAVGPMRSPAHAAGLISWRGGGVGHQMWDNDSSADFPVTAVAAIPAALARTGAGPSSRNANIGVRVRDGDFVCDFQEVAVAPVPAAIPCPRLGSRAREHDFAMEFPETAISSVPADVPRTGGGVTTFATTSHRRNRSKAGPGLPVAASIIADSATVSSSSSHRKAKSTRNQPNGRLPSMPTAFPETSVASAPAALPRTGEAPRHSRLAQNRLQSGARGVARGGPSSSSSKGIANSAGHGSLASTGGAIASVGQRAATPNGVGVSDASVADAAAAGLAALLAHFPETSSAASSAIVPTTVDGRPVSGLALPRPEAVQPGTPTRSLSGLANGRFHQHEAVRPSSKEGGEGPSASDTHH